MTSASASPTSSPSYKDSELYTLLNQSMPPLKRIEAALREASPRMVSDLIESEPECAFILDYYFRLFSPEVGARIVSDVEFDSSVLVELFSAQVIRYFRVHLTSEEYDPDYASLIESYWKHLSKERLMDLFKLLITSSESGRISAVMLLENLNLDDLRHINTEQARGLLEYFKELGGDFKEVISSNLNLYDYIYRLAVELEDEAYITFLDHYTNFAVQLRIAQNFVNDAGQHRDKSGKIPFTKLVELLRDVPPDSTKLTLELMKRAGYVDEATTRGLLELKAVIE